MRKTALLMLLISCSFALRAQNCLALGCADSYTITTDATQPDQASGPEWGCYNGYPRKETIWQYFYSPSGGNYTQSFASAADLDWIIFDMGTSFTPLNCPVSPLGWTQVGCDISYNPGGPTGPGQESNVTTTAGHYYAVALILWEPLALTFTFSTPQLGGSILTAANCLTILPVKIISFTASPDGNGVLLNWHVSDEINVSHYEIQGSADGQNFQTIANVAALSQDSYHFLYNGAAAAGLQYYRLKMVDADGKFSYSIIVKIENKSTNRFQITNNPVANVLSITGLKNTGEIRIMDLAGKIMLKKPVSSQALSVNATAMHPGLYMLQYADGNTLETLKFLKL
jgi:hypothetical protein